jgi:hypothetical protein
VGGTCGTNGGEDEHGEVIGSKAKGKETTRNQDVDGYITLRWTF